MLTLSIYFCTISVPQTVTPIEIFGFQSDDLVNLLVLKAHKDDPHATCVISKLPLLLQQLHDTKTKGDDSVRAYYLEFKF